MELFGQNEDGSSVRVIVKEIKDDEVTVDFNHPYAGKDLLFNVEILEVRDATEDEKQLAWQQALTLAVVADTIMITSMSAAAAMGTAKVVAVAVVTDITTTKKPK